MMKVGTALSSDALRLANSAAERLANAAFRRILASFAVASIAMTFAPSAGAYEIKTTDSGDPLRWLVSGVTFTVGADAPDSVDPAGLPALFEAAFAAWADAECDTPKAAYAGRTTATAATTPSFVTDDPDNVMVTLMSASDWAATGRSSSELAITLIAHDTATGEIVDADILFNDAGHMFSAEDAVPSGAADLPSVILHEVGHFLGLDHSEEASAIMFASYNTGQNRRTLDQDDLDGLCALYETVAACVYDGCDDGDDSTEDVCDPVLDCTHTPIGGDDGGCAAGGSQGPSALLFALMLLGLGAVQQRRRSILARD